MDCVKERKGRKRRVCEVQAVHTTHRPNNLIRVKSASLKFCVDFSREQITQWWSLSGKGAHTHTQPLFIHTHTPLHVLMQTNKCTHAPTQPRTHPFLEWQSISFINCVSQSFQHIRQAGITCSKALLRETKEASSSDNKSSEFVHMPERQEWKTNVTWEWKHGRKSHIRRPSHSLTTAWEPHVIPTSAHLTRSTESLPPLTFSSGKVCVCVSGRDAEKATKVRERK